MSSIVVHAFIERQRDRERERERERQAGRQADRQTDSMGTSPCRRVEKL
jgi:hypothetical protein